MEAGAEKLAKAVLGHPFRASEVSGMNFRCAVGVRCGIEAEEKLHDFLPGRAVRLGVEQPQVQLQMRLVIGGERRAERRFVQIFCVGHDEPHESFVSNLERFVNRNDIPRHTAAV